MAGTSKERSLVDPKLLETIDKLFELNIGQYVALPQLLVVGDQSSGKSSVLEGLTGLPFPRDSGLCTRFATQITFKRHPEELISVSIIPAAGADEGYANKLRAWKKGDLQALDRRGFTEILQEAQQLMGVGLPSDAGKRTFSSDVLKIEICGPKQQHLSVVDVPGIFRRITEGVTTQRDKALVRKMMIKNMENQRAVILAVIPANVDVATQEMLDMAEEIDKSKDRTLGVLTKPDLVDRGARHEINSLIEGKAHKLTLGWYMVRNPGQEDMNDPSWDRHAEEDKFFKTDPRFNKLPKARVGIESLQTRLREILANIVRKAFPHVKSDVVKQLKDRKRQLNDLGPSRETKEQQQRYLLQLAARFQKVTSLALLAHYGGDPIFEENPVLKLTTMFQNRNDLFSRDLELRGHTIKFNGQTDAGNFENERLAEGSGTNLTHLVYENPTLEFDDRSPLLLSKNIPWTANRYTSGHDELDDLLQPSGTATKSFSINILDWLEDLYKGSRGFELGSFDPAIVPIIWKKQTINWVDLAHGYIQDVVCLVHNFIVRLLRVCCVDERVSAGLLSVLIDPMTLRYQIAINHVEFLLKVERQGTPLTVNHYFVDNLEQSRQQRLKKLLQPNVIYNNELGNVVRLSNILDHHPVSNVEHTVRDIHDIIKSYYKVVRKTFVDNVCKQAAAHHLITGSDSPVTVFTPDFVIGLTTEQLEAVAGEDIASRRRRADLEREISNLEKGRKILV